MPKKRGFFQGSPDPQKTRFLTAFPRGCQAQPGQRGGGGATRPSYPSGGDHGLKQGVVTAGGSLDERQAKFRETACRRPRFKTVDGQTTRAAGDGLRNQQRNIPPGDDPRYPSDRAAAPYSIIDRSSSIITLDHHRQRCIIDHHRSTSSIDTTGLGGTYPGAWGAYGRGENDMLQKLEP